MQEKLIKDKNDIEKMRIAGKLAAQVLDYITPFVKEGVTTNYLDKLCYDYIINTQKAYPAPLNYQPNTNYPKYPKSICTSINEEVCHGIPRDRILKNGDIMNIDVTVKKDNYHGDTSRMFLIGNVINPAKYLCQITYESMWEGIKQVKPGNYLGDIGYAIEKYVNNNGFSVVREYCGHGIGLNFHENPQVLHYGKKNTGLQLQSGMIFTIEPMVNQGTRFIKHLSDKWTVVTKDHKLSAQWEHTILVTDDGFEVLTVSPDTTE